jgi:hypothetical protein
MIDPTMDSNSESSGAVMLFQLLEIDDLGVELRG